MYIPVDQFGPGLTTTFSDDKVIPAFQTKVDRIGFGNADRLAPLLGHDRFGATQIKKHQSDSRRILNRFFHGGCSNDFSAPESTSVVVIVVVHNVGGDRADWTLVIRLAHFEFDERRRREQSNNFSLTRSASVDQSGDRI